VKYSEAAPPHHCHDVPEFVRDDRQEDMQHYAAITIALMSIALDLNDKRLLSGRILIQLTLNIL
jgi:hypothetical protein